MRFLSSSVMRLAFCLLLGLPAAILLAGWWRGETLTMDLLEPSGDMAVRLMVLALLPGPLRDYFGHNALLRGWLSLRRYIGVGAFLYALLHFAAYASDMGSLPAMIDEIGLPGIWTGWIALFLLLPAAATSTDRAMRALGRRWKQVQWVVYPALLFSFAHWLLLEWSWQKAAIHGAPLMTAWGLRAIRRLQTRQRRMM